VYLDPPNKPWLFSGVYAPHISQGRALFWNSLANLGNSFGGGWLLLGDFNSILSSSEKCGGRAFGSSAHGDFADFVHSNALIDLGFVGNKFTLSNHRWGRDNIKERLDRGLANQNWVLQFPNSLINHLPATQSDHCPILISTFGSYRNIPKPFQFEAFWTRDKSSHAVVAEAWLVEVEGSLAFSLKEQLLREEVLWKQKYRELWLTSTDLNTKYFHASTVSRRRYNSISSLKSLDGSNICRRENIGNYLVQHFSSIFSTSNPLLDSSFSNLVGRVVTDDENDSLCTIPDEAKIFVAISDLGLNKAPGPDGMT
jgi:hypothetical protein